jgi:hypothetical protein
MLLKRNKNENQNFLVSYVHEDHYTRDRPHRTEVSKLFKGNSQPVVLTHPFPQQQSLVAQNLAPPQGGNPGHPLSEDASSSAHIYMFNDVYLTTRTTTYDTPPGKPCKESVTNGTVTNPPSTLVTLCLDLSILRNLNLTLYYICPRVLSESRPLILTLVMPRTKTSLKIWHKHLVQCWLSKFYNISPTNVGLSWRP